jgi:hypothetical protein
MVDGTDKKKEAKKKLYRKHHLIFTSKDLYDGFNLLIFMAQYEDDIIIDDTIIEYTGDFFIYHIKCSYNLPLNLDIYKNQNGTVIDVFLLKELKLLKQVIYFENYDYYEHINSLIEELESHNIKVIDIIISSRVIKSGSKVTHTLIVESLNKIKVEIEKIEPYPDIQGIVIKFNGGGVIEV